MRVHVGLDLEENTDSFLAASLQLLNQHVSGKTSVYKRDVLILLRGHGQQEMTNECCQISSFLLSFSPARRKVNKCSVLR